MIYFLAVLRLTHIVVSDSVGYKLYEWVDEEINSDFLNELMSCTKCFSVWAGIGLAVVNSKKINQGLAASLFTVLASQLLTRYRLGWGDE